MYTKIYRYTWIKLLFSLTSASLFDFNACLLYCISEHFFVCKQSLISHLTECQMDLPTTSVCTVWACCTFPLFNFTGNLLDCARDRGKRLIDLWKCSSSAYDICQSVASILTASMTTATSQRDPTSNKGSLHTERFNNANKRTLTILIWICHSGTLECLHSLKKKDVIQNKERLTQLKKKKTHTHANTHKRTHSCTHLFVSEPVGICHMPGRFCNLGRWYSTIKRSQSLNQSPACHMKSQLRFVLHQHACPLSMQCLVCKLPLLSHKNPFSCLAVPQKNPFLACFFFFFAYFSSHPLFSASQISFLWSIPSSFPQVCFLYPFLPWFVLTTGLNARQ